MFIYLFFIFVYLFIFLNLFFIFIILNFFVFYFYKYFLKSVKSVASTLSTDTISGIKTVYSFVWEKEAVKRYLLLLKDFYHQGVKKAHFG